MIIAGAGIVGLSCAWKLALCKIPVTVFDARQPGAEASWAGAGMLAPGGELEEASPLTEMALRSLALYPEFVRALEQQSGLTIDYRRCGAIEIALCDREAEELAQRAQRQAQLGIASERARFRDFAHARFFPDDAIVDPRQIVAALVKVCVDLGVVIRGHEPVQEICATGVRTSRGVYRDDAVLIAAGAWSSDLTRSLALPRSSPVRGHLISYNMQKGSLDTILRHQNTYLLQRSSGALIAGASTEHRGFDRSLDEAVVSDIRRRAAGLLPELAGLEPSDKWVGFRPGIDAAAPQVGRVDGTNIWTAYGHYRNGILLAPDTAERIVASVTQTH